MGLVTMRKVLREGATSLLGHKYQVDRKIRYLKPACWVYVSAATLDEHSDDTLGEDEGWPTTKRPKGCGSLEQTGRDQARQQSWRAIAILR